MSDAERTYTVEEARSLVPQVRAILLQLAVERRRVDGTRDEHVEALLAHLESLDVVLRDVERGLVDFPTIRDGERAWLCWRLADPDLAYWHSTREGYASRRPL
jgi:hypothetical protein